MEERLINIALLDDGWIFVWATENFEKILDGYTWTIGNKRYTFKTIEYMMRIF